MREANDCTPSVGRPGADPPRAGEQHHHAREPGVYPFVGPEIGCVEWKEGPPVDKPMRPALPATQIVRIRVVGILRIVEDKREERIVAHIGTAKVEAVAGRDLRMAETVGGHRKFDRHQCLVSCNQTNQIDRTDQMNKTSWRTFSHPAKARGVGR